MAQRRTDEITQGREGPPHQHQDHDEQKPYGQQHKGPAVAIGLHVECQAHLVLPGIALEGRGHHDDDGGDGREHANGLHQQAGQQWQTKPCPQGNKGHRKRITGAEAQPADGALQQPVTRDEARRQCCRPEQRAQDQPRSRKRPHQAVIQCKRELLHQATIIEIRWRASHSGTAAVKRNMTGKSAVPTHRKGIRHAVFQCSKNHAGAEHLANAAVLVLSLPAGMQD